jgi:iron complex transport system ATP-binding protein
MVGVGTREQGTRNMGDPDGSKETGVGVLEAIDVSYQIGPAVLVDGVSLEARAGEVLSVVGPNGAGKSTLLRLLTGELQPTAGDVRLAGRTLGEYSPKQLALKRAVLPQQTMLQFAFTVRAVVEMGRDPHIRHGESRREDLEAVDRALGETDMMPFAERIYPSLSGGEQSRVNLSRVLAQETRILLLDEPTSSLDVRHQEMVMRLAHRLSSEGACVLVIVHDLNLAAAYSDRIALLQRGRLVTIGSTCEVLRDDVLSDVFECPLRVLRDGEFRHPLIVPRRP